MKPTSFFTLFLSLLVLFFSFGTVVEAHEKFDVVILPTEEFPSEELDMITQRLRQETGLKIFASLPIGTQHWQPHSDPPQYDPEAFHFIATPTIDRLRRHYGAKVHIILTGYDLAPPDGSLNFVFSWNQHEDKVSVVSAARLLLGENNRLAAVDLIRERVHKMMLRTIAIQYHEQPRSTHPQDLTYSPLMALEDLDQLTTKAFPKPKGPTI